MAEKRDNRIIVAGLLLLLLLGFRSKEKVVEEPGPGLGEGPILVLSPGYPTIEFSYV